jgi:hypothetical protein
MKSPFGHTGVLVAVLFVSGLLGCAGVSQQEADELVAKWEAKIDADPLVKRLEGKVRLRKAEEYTLTQLSDNTFPDASDKEAILAWDRILTPMASEATQLFNTKGAPGNNTIVQQYLGASKDNLLSLYQGAISFGEFNRTAKRLYEIQMELVGKLQAASAQQANTAWANSLKSMGDSYQARQRQTVNTNCYALGNSVSCTSR